ncbi:MAG: inorganic pyrophosphatase [Gammaproteobacteria bacterium RIFCSPHIGHO2_12_FULL_35_23]|nr:MAG: inorganic pyrophosphatase [Gammaproteobacteria bacterium RIFCSPHIGHO2_12_FULL_35_23]
MGVGQVGPGDKAPDEINVIIEIPAAGVPVKYEIDKATGAMFVDRFMATSMYYPCNYGYIPHTLALDGDPADVLVITPFPLISGSVIRCRPIATLDMADESGHDAKILAVPLDKLTTHYSRIKSAEDVSPELRASIRHFFEHYKDLEPGKWVKVNGWTTLEIAKKEIIESIKRFNAKS